MTDDIDGVIKILVGSSIGAPLFWLFIKKVLVGGRVQDAKLAGASAESDVIEMLRKEVQRMSDSNKSLGIALQEFQRENLELRREICELHQNIGSLSDRLNILSRVRYICSECGEDNTNNLPHIHQGLQ